MDAADAEDTLDLKTLDQLHAVVLEFSKTSQELKKLCVGLVTAVPTLIFTATEQEVDESMFVAGLLIAASFWFADSYTYFYQDKVRARMSDVANTLRIRSGVPSVLDGMGMPIEGRGPSTRLSRSFFNPSHLIYGILAGVSIALWTVFAVAGLST